MLHTPLVLEHEILVLDANLRSPLDAKNYKKITEDLIGALLHFLGMEELGPLQIYPAQDLRAPGWSFIQPITTSHISGHYFEIPGEPPHIHMDIYSCKKVNYVTAIRLIDQELKFADWSANFLVRNIDHKLRKNIVLKGFGRLLEPANETSRIEMLEQKSKRKLFITTKDSNSLLSIL